MPVIITIVCVISIVVIVRRKWKAYKFRKRAKMATEAQPGYTPPDLPEENISEKQDIMV